jgi:TP53 regulating kinase-like protein
MEITGLLSQCAESEVLSCVFYGQPAIVKHRVVKSYRHPQLDKKIREQRTAREARALVKAKRCGVPTPAVYAVDKAACIIVMERIDGVTVRDAINGCAPTSELTVQLLERMGALVAKMHSGDQIHGDLTTSNFMIRDPGDTNSLVVIDFGLVRQSADAEERAVDVYVLERAISSTHPLVENPMSHVWRGYAASSLPRDKVDATWKRLEQVRMRGRKRSMVG